MSEADRVFARLGDQAPQPTSDHSRLIVSASRRSGPGGGKSRVVEVVHVRRGPAKPAEPDHRPAHWNEHAETWPDGFRAKAPRPAPAQDPLPVAAEAPPPVAHVLTRWAPSLPPVVATAESPPDAVPPAQADKPRRGRPPAVRKFADPFADDGGTNCLRCGYLVEPAREARGHMICARCA